MKTFQEFFAASAPYIEFFNAFSKKHNLAGTVRADHICYKCGSIESFENLRKILENESDYVYQSIISNRRIAIIRFKQGIETSLGMINYLELSDQKPDNSQHDGFDHIEAYPADGSYEALIEQLESSEYVIKTERPHHTTHDIDIGDGFLFRCTRGPLIEKIKGSEMV